MKKLDAFTVYLEMEGALAFLFGMIFTASSVYQVTTVGLTPLQLVLVGTVLEASVFIFEVPTGVVADVYSRRLSIIIGVFLIGLGFILEGSIPLFWTILLAQVLWGIGYTFTSGATQAWISDEIGESGAGRAFMRASQVEQIASLLGIGMGMLVGNVRVNLPIQLGGFCLMLLGFFLILSMPETGFKPAAQDERNSWKRISYTFRQGLKTVRRRPALMTILTIGLFYGLYSEGLDRLWIKHILDNFSLPQVADLQPVVWIGLVQAVSMALSVGAIEVARRRVDTNSHIGVARALFILTLLLAASLFVFAWAGPLFLALLAYWLIDVAREVISPIYSAWVNQRLDSDVRATVISMSGQVDAVGQIAGGPIVGMIGGLLSVRAALFASTLILSPTLALYRWVIHRDMQPELVTEQS
ncbi:MAG: MFS transporter [Anaerolineales bacterium]|nr:MFS transporter [Anaerolineales bacterium]